METLWAPWRMAYIDRVTDSQPPAECIFCRALGAGDRESLVVHRGALSLIMLNRFPYNPGHLMVAPRSHGGDLAVLDAAELADVVGQLQLATRVLEAELDCDGFNGGWNQGRVAGAGIDTHLHFHLVPRWSGDTNFMPVLADVKVVPEHLDATWEKLSSAFAASRDE
jgi:ATP adenylyltransferase